MRIGAKDVRGIVLSGIAGLLCASLFQIGHLVTGKLVGEALCVQADNISANDRALVVVLKKLESVLLDVDRVQFCRFVDIVDRLVFLQVQLSNGHIEPMLQDRIDGFAYCKQAKEILDGPLKQTIERLFTDGVLSAKRAVEIERMTSTAHDMIEAHLQLIMNLTNDSL